jgi:predicted metalloprotease with PDZ domain
LAGLAAEDEIVALDGLRLRAADLEKRLKSRSTGATARITFFRRDELRTVDVVVAARPEGRWTVTHAKNPTELQRAAYTSWLGQPWPSDAEKPAEQRAHEPASVPEKDR